MVQVASAAARSRPSPCGSWTRGGGSSSLDGASPSLNCVCCCTEVERRSRKIYRHQNQIIESIVPRVLVVAPAPCDDGGAGGVHLFRLILLCLRVVRVLLAEPLPFRARELHVGPWPSCIFPQFATICYAVRRGISFFCDCDYE